MYLHSKIHPISPLDQKDYLEIIDNFNKQGKVIDDRGRNLIKLFHKKSVDINVKSFKIPHIINKIAYKYVRPSKARRSFEHACLLIDKKIGTPQPLAYFEFFTPLGIGNSYYFSEHIEYDLTFKEIRSDPNYPDRERILREFTKFTFDLHEQGIFFKDHSHGNTLIKKKDDQYYFYLIDLNRMDFYSLDINDRMKNFAKLTEDVDMVKIMSDEYAKLISESPELIFDKMWAEIQRYRKKYQRRQNLKNMFRGS